MAFEKFTQTGRSFKPKVTIRKTGSLGFTAAAISKFGIDNYKYALLYYDKDAQKIGLKPTNDEEDGAHKINRAKQSTWIAARRFLDYYGITLKNGRFDAMWDDEEQMIVIEIKGGDSSKKEK